MPVEHRLRLGQYSERSRSDEVLQRERAKVDAVIVGAWRWVLWRKVEREAEREASAAVGVFPEEDAMKRLAEGSGLAGDEPRVILSASLEQGDVAVEDEKARGRVAA